MPDTSLLLMWTVLPRGIDTTQTPTQARISVLVSPRVTLTGSGPPGSLADVPDLLDWPARVAGLQFTIEADPGTGASPVSIPAAVVPGTLDSALWQALFPGAVLVQDRVFDQDGLRSLSPNSYGNATVVSGLKTGYTGVFTSSPVTLPARQVVAEHFPALAAPAGPRARLLSRAEVSALDEPAIQAHAARRRRRPRRARPGRHPPGRGPARPGPGRPAEPDHRAPARAALSQRRHPGRRAGPAVRLPHGPGPGRHDRPAARVDPLRSGAAFRPRLAARPSRAAVPARAAGRPDRPGRKPAPGRAPHRPGGPADRDGHLRAGQPAGQHHALQPVDGDRPGRGADIHPPGVRLGQPGNAGRPGQPGAARAVQPQPGRHRRRRAQGPQHVRAAARRRRQRPARDPDHRAVALPGRPGRRAQEPDGSGRGQPGGRVRPGAGAGDLVRRGPHPRVPRRRPGPRRRRVAVPAPARRHVLGSRPAGRRHPGGRRGAAGRHARLARPAAGHHAQRARVAGPLGRLEPVGVAARPGGRRRRPRLPAVRPAARRRPPHLVVHRRAGQPAPAAVRARLRRPGPGGRPRRGQSRRTRSRRRAGHAAQPGPDRGHPARPARRLRSGVHLPAPRAGTVPGPRRPGKADRRGVSRTPGHPQQPDGNRRPGRRPAQPPGRGRGPGHRHSLPRGLRAAPGPAEGVPADRGTGRAARRPDPGGRLPGVVQGQGSTDRHHRLGHQHRPGRSRWPTCPTRSPGAPARRWSWWPAAHRPFRCTTRTSCPCLTCPTGWRPARSCATCPESRPASRPTWSTGRWSSRTPTWPCSRPRARCSR